MRDREDLLWLAVIGGAGFLGWKLWTDYQASLPVSSGISTPAAPLLLAPINLTAPTPTAPIVAPIATTTTDTTGATTTPAATATAPQAQMPQAANDAFTDQEAAAHDAQTAYFTNYTTDIQNRIATGQLVPGTPDFAAQQTYLAAQGIKI